ncbi:MAG: transglycosylase domain-containing protein [Gammaproteobacteria bacterium]|nr:transglycosylase domain-containing protein [Gammaproteobacteria bacterium]MBK7522159.1 transglycosylase domain-containing protein [Gammaproteobacteria bacterium]MBK7727368.1 transglycosylase domain-containing protein [Gammaproteobacteria bacterium]MBK8308194.1 transglycosylase domain-containing protein [Gammaproteobacteria bacterium]
MGPVLRITLGVILLGELLALGYFAHDELRNATWQSRWLADFAAGIGFHVESGPAREPLPPDRGPWDERLGYAGLPAFRQRLLQNGFVIERQAVPSRRLSELAAHGVFNVYPEKNQTGLQLRDMNGAVVQQARYPRTVYPDYESIPQLVVQALLFVEDRELLDESRPTMNPVVDWERLAMAVAQQGLKTLGREHKVIGASTLATQLEKFRHAPDGITREPRDKLYQMAAASLRVYSQGRYTLAARRGLLLDYLNSLPLAAQPGFGEVSSLGDGLQAWYGSDFGEVSRVLASADAPLAERARYYKQALSLILSVRRPSYYLGQDTAALADLTNSYLRRMASEGAIARSLADAALAVPLEIRKRAGASPVIDFTRQKGINLARTRLLSLLDVRSLYELDRLDLSVRTSLDVEVQRGVADFLRSLAKPEVITELGLTGARLLRANDPGKVIYSLTLYERGHGYNRLRINADNLDQPLDINAGAKLDLGSTAKLRTLISWLELIAGAYDRYRVMSSAELAAVDVHPRDRLSAWVIAHLQANRGADLRSTLESAMRRQYSASTAQRFYTGGGVHTFANFERADNGRVLTVAEALRRSVNLVFIRVMREVIDHYMYRAPSTTARLLENASDPARGDYLRRFADREGTVFLRRFYEKYRGKTRDEALGTLLDGVRVTPRAVVVALRSVWPDMQAADLAPWMARYVPDEQYTPAALDSLFNRYPPEKFNLNDRGYLARVHPLELWLIDYLLGHPGARVDEAIAASADVRQEVYRWLMKTSRRKAQDRRILDLLEIEAFQELHQQWQRLGYPFASLTPSIATSIGSSGDRPAALAELMGIIVNGGMRFPARLIEGLHFAADTPYETAFEATAAEGKPVLNADIAAVARAALIDVAENGTARALLGYVKRPDGTRHLVGGKTGTGDHRFEVYASPGRLISSRVVNRVATFVFMIDDRFYGTITAFVPGAQAAQYEFTSGLPVRLLGALMPTLAPLLERAPDPAPGVSAGS